MSDDHPQAVRNLMHVLRHQPPLKWCKQPVDPEAEFDHWVEETLAELQAGQQTLTEAVEALAKRVGQLAARLDGQQRYGSPTNETKQDREQRLRDERLRNSPNAPSSMFRR